LWTSNTQHHDDATDEHRFPDADSCGKSKDSSFSPPNGNNDSMDNDNRREGATNMDAAANKQWCQHNNDE
jgi:hypothetical protein